MATGMMIDGQWTNEEYQKDSQGRFQRNPTTFRDRITADGKSGFPAVANRYHPSPHLGLSSFMELLAKNLSISRDKRHLQFRTYQTSLLSKPSSYKS